MQKVTPVPSCLADSIEAKASLSAQASVSDLAMSEGYRRVRCSAAMIGLAISMSAVNILLPHQSKPVLAAEPVNAELSVTNNSSEPAQAEVKLTPPALKHQVKEGESIWQLSENYQVTPEAIAASNNLTPGSDLEVGQTIKIPSVEESTPADVTTQAPKNLAREQSESLDGSLDNLRQSRKRLQESLVALRSEETRASSTPTSETQVIVTDVSEVDPVSETTTPIKTTVTALTPSVPEPQAIEIPVEMPSAEAELPNSVTPNPTPLITATPTPKADNSPSTSVSLPTPKPIPIPSVNNTNLPQSREEDARSLRASKPEDDFNNSIPIPVITPDTSSNNQFSTPAKNQPEEIPLEVESPQTATIVPPVRTIPAPEAVNSSRNVQAAYRVQKGDTLNSIARRHGISVAQLIKANNITNPNLIKANQALVIPSKSVPQRTVVTGIPLRNQGNNSFLPPVPQPSTLVSSLPAPTQSQDLSNIEAVNIPVEVASESYTEKLRNDFTNIQADYGQTQAIPLTVEPAASNEIISQQVRNPEWDYDRRQRDLRQQNQAQSSSPEGQLIGAAPINVEEYNNRLRVPVGETVSPELPSLSEPNQYLPDAPVEFAGYIWPAKGVLTSGYGWRWGRMHKGVDIAGPVGTPIVAAAPGQVISAGWNSGGYGNLVKLRHPDGSITFYAHNSRILVRRGQIVQQGELIAEMGSTGRSTGPHLHFEVHPGGTEAKNPMAYLPRK
jgi:murein DD-endopeptidase MepM/ murein hydrolase activator NlpD